MRIFQALFCWLLRLQHSAACGNCARVVLEVLLKASTEGFQCNSYSSYLFFNLIGLIHIFFIVIRKVKSHNLFWYIQQTVLPSKTEKLLLGVAAENDDGGDSLAADGGVEGEAQQVPFAGVSFIFALYTHLALFRLASFSRFRCEANIINFL